MKYAVCYVDEMSNFTEVFPIKYKSNVTQALSKYITTHGPIKRLRADNGGEYTSAAFQELCATYGIKLEFTTPYNPHMNGKAERMWRTLANMTRCQITQATLSKQYWALAISNSAYLYNIHTRKGAECSPYQLFTGKEPKERQLRVFGCVAYAHIPRALKLKRAELAFKAGSWGTIEEALAFSFTIQFKEECTDRST
jgi:hypothetical protein